MAWILLCCLSIVNAQVTAPLIKLLEARANLQFIVPNSSSVSSLYKIRSAFEIST